MGSATGSIPRSACVQSVRKAIMQLPAKSRLAGTHGWLSDYGMGCGSGMGV
jgi:hypothetical protein